MKPFQKSGHDDAPVHAGQILGEDLHPHRRGDKRFLLWFLVVLVGGVMAWVASGPAYRQIKTRRAQRMSGGIMAEINAGAGTNVLQQVRLILSLAPNDEQVLRTAARYCTTNRQPEAFTYWEMLLALVPGTREDHLAFAQVAADAGRYEVATRELSGLLNRPGGDVEAARVALRLAMKRGAWELAARTAEHVLQLAPDDRQAELWRDIALIRTRQPAAIAVARNSLLTLLFQSGEAWREGVDVLLECPDLSRDDLGLIRWRLAELDSEAIADQLRFFSVEWRISPERHGPILDHVKMLAASARSGPDVELTGRWLLVHGAADVALELFPRAQTQGDRVRMQIHVLALARLGRWDEVTAVTSDTGSGLDAHVATVLSVAAACQKPNGTDQTVVRALLADRNLRGPELVEAVQIAEENGLNEAAILLLEYLLDLPALMPEVANRILMLSGRVEHLTLRRRALDRLVSAFPNDPLALPQLGYVEAVLPGGNLRIIDRVEKLPGSATNQFAQLVCALGEVRRGKGEAALTRLAVLSPPGDAMDYRLHLAYAAAYGVAGAATEARRHAALADQAPLQIEERALIRRWLPLTNR